MIVLYFQWITLNVNENVRKKAFCVLRIFKNVTTEND